MFIPIGDRPLLMSILNVTPDSFSDGGRFGSVEMAVEAGLQQVVDGADIVDVGGESTRPGAGEVSVDEECWRVVPVVEALATAGVTVSVDTRKAAVAQAATAAGATIINDVSGLREPEMRRVAAESGATVCIMHMQGDPSTMQQNPSYKDVVQEVRNYLLAQAQLAIQAGVKPDRIWLDPGIGFGKTQAHNLQLLRHLDRLTAQEYPVLIGVSRKGFIGTALGGLPVSERLEGTLAVQVLVQSMGAKVIRAHDVVAARRAIDMTGAVLTPSESSMPLV